MNKTTAIAIVGGVVILGLIGGLIYMSTGNTPVTEIVNPPVVVTNNTQPNPPAPSLVPPGATTNPTVYPTDTTAIVSGTVALKGALTSYWYEYGTTANLGSKTGTLAIGYGTAAIPAPGFITGLTKNTKYFFRLVAENQYGRTAGARYSFVTTQGNPPPVGSAPTVSTVAASSVSRNSVNLNGRVNPNQAITQFWFEYGTTPNLGNITALESVSSGNSTLPASISLSNLMPMTTYYFRLNAQNQFGTVNGSILNFKTTGPVAATAPTVTTLSASVLKTTTATLRGSINPNGAETTYWFEYSKDSQFGSTSTMTTTHIKSTTLASIITVDTDVENLTPNTNYYYRVVAQNSVGLTHGDKVSFSTKR